MSDIFDDIDNMNDDDVIVLYNEQLDKEEEFYFLATLDVDDKWYIVMKPVEQLDDIADNEVLIYELAENESGDTVMLPIEEEDRLNKVFEEFMKMAGDELECDCDCADCADPCDQRHDED